MPEIRAFRGWRYSPWKIGNFSKVVAPPYDVISKAEQDELHRKSPYNVVRLILGKRPGPYARARKFLESWIREGVLTHEGSPAIYVYVQDYHGATRVGFIAAMKIKDRAVLKHENTLAAPKKDRMALIKEVRANLSPIFGLFEDKKGEVQKILNRIVGAPLAGARGRAQGPPLRDPAIDITLDGVRHRLFVETRPPVVRAIQNAMRSKPVFIADGHHRFEVACQYRNWMNSRRGAVSAPGRGNLAPTDRAGWNYVMMYFSDCLHNPFTIYPTHRLIRTRKDILPRLRQRGILKKVKSLGGVLSHLSKKQRGYRFGVYTKKGGFFILALDKKFAPPKNSNIVDQLAVAVLHRSLIEPCFGIQKIEKSGRIDFTRDPKAAVESVNRGRFDLAFFLPATSLGDMLEVSKRGLKMPQKSTYFYPKLLSGLVFHRFENGGCLD